MDWNFAIDKHREALKRVLAALVAMVGGASSLPFPGAGPFAGSPTGSSRPIDTFLHATGMTDFGQGPIPATLPRHLHRAVLRLLRPAEAAARRLVIVAARDIVMPLPALRATTPASQARNLGRGRPQRRSSLVGGVDGLSAVAQRAEAEGGGTASAYPARMAFPLLDPLRRAPDQRRLRASRTAMPRISVPGWSEPAPLPKPPAPDDEIDATRLALRLAALARALDDLPREARRFARWKARNAAGMQYKEHAASAQSQKAADAARAPARRHRISPLRFGPPPGQLPPGSRRSRHEVHQILEDVHGLAFDALEAPDTS